MTITKAYQSAWHETKRAINANWKAQGYTLSIQGTFDVTGLCNLQELAGNHGLTSKQYEQLINKGQKYLDQLISNRYFKVN
jgi:hypothetical protein